MTCGSYDSLITGINSGWSCYSVLQLSAFVRLCDSLHGRLQTTGIFRHQSVYLSIFTRCFTKVAEHLDQSSSARNSLEVRALSRLLSHDAWRGKNFRTRKKHETCKSRKATGKVNNCSWRCTIIKCYEYCICRYYIKVVCRSATLWPSRLILWSDVK